MKDFSQVFHDKIDTIIEKWIAAVYQDEQIETAKELTYKHVRDSVPLVLQAIATMLSQSQGSDIQTLVQKSLDHGTLRAKQGYDAEEIAREYSILRWVIFSTLEVELTQGSPAEIIRAVRLIDTALDEVIAHCFKSYTEERLRELKQLQSQLRMTNQELTRLVRASKENLAHLAHELKTPLTSIIGYSDLFLRQQKENHKVQDDLPNLGHIERVLNSGRQLIRLINDALEISRYEAGKMKLQPQKIEVQSLIKSVLETVEPLAQTKGLEIVVDSDRAPTQVVTDPLRLQQVVTNLLSNAIRYTKSGSIKIICQQLASQWSIAIADTGVGIQPEDQAHIFEPYYRCVTPEQTYVPNSTGLGLAIVSRCVKILQGEIELVSQVGVGSTFTVILPLEVKVLEEAIAHPELEVES
jgi:signal transduction histidine kinase